jgi:17beta-estradiol 17-dehydrogenase / very-long-chain 3-oxoacyl-CoA reductase
LFAVGGLSIYGATKKFFSTWSQALAQEVQGHGVTVINLDTFFVVSKLSRIKSASFLIPDPKNYVSWILDRMGLAGGSVYPHSMAHQPSHAICTWLLMNLFTWSMLLYPTHRIMMSTRQKVLDAREKKTSTFVSTQVVD